MKRFAAPLALILCLVLCAAAFASCALNGDDETASPAETTSGFCTVTFVVLGTEYTVQTKRNQVPVCPVTPPKTASDPNGINLNYMGWDKEIAAVTEDTVYTAQYGSAATVLPAKDGAKGILTITYDDGLYDTAVWVNQKNKQYGLNGSCMLVVNKLSSSMIAKWKTLFTDGTLEPECHSMTHDTLPADWSKHYLDTAKKGNNNQPKYKYELIDSKNKLEELFPGKKILCFAPADNTLSTASFALDANGNADFSRPLDDGGAQAVANANYYAIRQGRYGIQSLDPTLDAETGGWYNLKIQWFREWMNGNANGLSWLDDTVGDGGWLIVMCHAIYGNGASSTGSKDLTVDDAERFFAYASTFIKSGSLWAATFGEATKYIRERQNTTVTERYDKDKNAVYVDMKINRTTKDGKVLTQSIFNYPLTVEVRVPANWKSARYVNENGKTQVTTAYTRDGVSYMTVNMIPGADGATVTTDLLLLGTK